LRELGLDWDQPQYSFVPGKNSKLIKHVTVETGEAKTNSGAPPVE
jgi:hypothetical protein